MNRPTTLMFACAVIAQAGAIWAVTHGHQVSALTYAVNGLTMAVLTVAVVITTRNRP